MSVQKWWSKFNNFIVDRSQRNFLVRRFQVLCMGIKSFMQGKSLQQAPALTYYTLFAIVPLAALAFGIAKGFDLYDSLREYIRTEYPEQESLWSWVYEFADTAIRTASGGIVAGVGVLLLLWTVVRLADSVEVAFNQIWHVSRGRTVFRKLSDFLAVFVISPFLLVITISGTAYARKVAANLQEMATSSTFFTQPLLSFIIPIFMVWIFFVFLYLFVPNTRVRPGSAMYGALIAALCYQGAQVAFFQIFAKMSSYNSIYASFSALPLFLIWVQWSWLIILLGAEIAFVDQHYSSGQFDKRLMLVSEDLRYKYILTICAVIIHTFEEQDLPMTEYQVVAKTELPPFRVRESLNEMVDCGLLCRVELANENDIGYLPGEPTDQLTIGRAFEVLSRHGLNDDHQEQQTDFVKVANALEQIKQSGFASDANKLLRDL